MRRDRVQQIVTYREQRDSPVSAQPFVSAGDHEVGAPIRHCDLAGASKLSSVDNQSSTDLVSAVGEYRAVDPGARAIHHCAHAHSANARPYCVNDGFSKADTGSVLDPRHRSSTCRTGKPRVCDAGKIRRDQDDVPSGHQSRRCC